MFIDVFRRASCRDLFKRAWPCLAIAVSLGANGIDSSHAASVASTAIEYLEFVHQAGKSYARTCSNTQSFDGVHADGLAQCTPLQPAAYDPRVAPQDGLFTLPSTPRPPGAQTQWLSFDLDGSNFLETLASRRDAHFISSLFFNIEPRDGQRPAVRGRGLLIGEMAGRADRCGLLGRPGVRAEVETLWAGGNALFPSSCSAASIPAGKRLRFSLRVTGRWITYAIRDEYGSLLETAQVYDDRNPEAVEAHSGLAFAYVMPADPNITFVLRLSNIRSGWV